jgi:hypothetical protein
MKPSDANGPVFLASVPTSTTRWWRTFLPYQFFRFAVINVKMVRLLLRAHHDTKPPV